MCHLHKKDRIYFKLKIQSGPEGAYTGKTGWDRGWTPEAPHMRVKQMMTKNDHRNKDLLFDRHEKNYSTFPEMPTYEVNRLMRGCDQLC